MKKGKRIVGSILCLILLCALATPARAETPEVNIVWLPEGVTPVDASLWSIKGRVYGDDVRAARKGDLIAVRRDGEYGYMNTKGELVVPFTQTSINAEWYFFYSDGLLPVPQYDGNGQFKNTRYVDREGNTVLELEEGFCGFAFQDGVAMVKGQDSWGETKYGAIDTKGNVVVPYEYDDVSSGSSDGAGFINGFCVMMKENAEGWFFVSSDGKTLIPRSDYEDEHAFSEGMAAVERDGKWGYVDTTGRLVVPCIYDANDYMDFQNGFAVVEKDGKYGYINTKGEEITAIEFDSAGPFDSFGLASVRTEMLFYHIDRTGHEADHPLVPLDVLRRLSTEGYTVYTNVTRVADDRILVGKDEKIGYTDANGELTIPLEFDGSSDVGLFTSLYIRCQFSSGLALVCKSGKWGYINKQGDPVVPFESEYDNNVGLIMGGYVGVVYKDGRYGIFENPYYKEPTSSSGLLSGLLGDSSGSTASGGSTTGSSSVASYLLPVAGALAVVVAGGGFVLLKKKRR